MANFEEAMRVPKALGLDPTAARLLSSAATAAYSAVPGDDSACHQPAQTCRSVSKESFSFLPAALDKEYVPLTHQDVSRIGFAF